MHWAILSRRSLATRAWIKARKPSPRHAVWLAFACALLAGAFVYLDALRTRELAAAYGRAETAARNAERAVLRSFEAERGVHEMLLLRQRFLTTGETDAMDGVETQIRHVVDEHRQGIMSVFVSDINGRINWSDNPSFQGLDISDRGYFRALFLPGAPQLSVSEPLLARVSGKWRVIVARLIRDATGRPVAVGAVVVDPNYLSQELADIAPGPGQVVVIRNRVDGSLRAHSQASEARWAEPPRPSHPMLVAARSEPQGRGEMDGREGHRRLQVWQVTPELPLVVLSSLDRATELEDYRRTFFHVSAMIVLVLSLTLALSLAWERNAASRRSLALEAIVDPLTGLHNRRGLAQAAASALLPYGAGPPVSLLLFDLDHFGAFNARFGHAGGDAALKAVARALQRAVRPGDIVCRWGGEEIVVMLRDCPPAMALLRAEAMRSAIESNTLPGLDRITASVGVACAPPYGATLENLAAEADRALYAAKRAGRNRVIMAEAA